MKRFLSVSIFLRMRLSIRSKISIFVCGTYRQATLHSNLHIAFEDVFIKFMKFIESAQTIIYFRVSVHVERSERWLLVNRTIYNILYWNLLLHLDRKTVPIVRSNIFPYFLSFPFRLFVFSFL